MSGRVPAVRRMSEEEVWRWVAALRLGPDAVVAAAAAVAMECLMEVATRRRVRRCGRPADAIVVPTLKGFLQ